MCFYFNCDKGTKVDVLNDWPSHQAAPMAASTLTVEDTNNMPKIDDKEAMAGEDLETIIITKQVVLGKLMGLKVDKSPGPDGMHPRVLKEMAGEIANALVVIFQNSLDSGVVPADWKTANVTPLFKKGGRQKAG